MSVEITNESTVPIAGPKLAALARHVLGQMDVHPLAELSILVVDVDYMAELNERWMGEEGPTDVLAFPMDELSTTGRPGIAPGDLPEDEDDPTEVLLGDIVLCPAVAVRQAAAAGQSFEDELNMLTTHGILHLLGYDHATPDEEREMFGLQGRLLTSWHELMS